MAVKYVHDIPKSICNRNHAKKDLQKHPICLNESDNDYFLEEIEHIEKLELDINLRDHGDEKYILFILSHFLFHP